MASYQRVALYILFDAIEQDLVERLRTMSGSAELQLLTGDERSKAKTRLQRRDGPPLNCDDDFDLLHGLDIGDKYAVLLRHKSLMNQAAQEYYLKARNSFERSVSIRNATMHGRPLTTTEYALGFSLANDFLKSANYWPKLASTYRRYTESPQSFVSESVALLDEDIASETLNNLPVPDYDDTGFVPRPDLEKDLRKKLFGRHPVITVLGEGGNGKTALTLQTLYGLLHSNDHDFDAIAWVSAKSTRLTNNEITRIEGAITTSLGVFEEVAETFEPGNDAPLARVRRLLESNKVLLVIDNLETVLDDNIREFASDVPGQSKILFTSRVPLGSDLSVLVGDFSENEAKSYLHRLADAYDVPSLKKKTSDQISRYIKRLSNKPLLLKWFALGVASGADADRITANPEVALQFCMENVIGRLANATKSLASIVSTLPGAVSPSVIGEVSGFPAQTVEAALAELMRFGLLQRDEKAKYERAFQIKPFAKSYITRFLKISSSDANDVLSKYRSIDSAYQINRGSQQYNPYDSRNFIVRSRSEAIAARRIKSATTFARKDQFSQSEEILAELKISDPDYFETFRADAYIAYKQGDMSRATNSYEIALELAERQPQLHYFYAGFLWRALGDGQNASKQFDIALSLDPGSSIVLREAARIKFFTYDFDAAQLLISRAGQLEIKNSKEEVVLADLQSQLFIRKAEHLSGNGQPKGAVEALQGLYMFLCETENFAFDRIHVTHLLKAMPVIDALQRNSIVSHEEVLTKTLNKILEIASLEGANGGAGQSTGTSSIIGSPQQGNLRSEGRTAYFGFIRNSSGVDTYVRREWTGDHLWVAMCSGRSVRYEVATDGNSNWAVNVALA